MSCLSFAPLDHPVHDHIERSQPLVNGRIGSSDLTQDGVTRSSVGSDRRLRARAMIEISRLGKRCAVSEKLQGGDSGLRVITACGVVTRDTELSMRGRQPKIEIGGLQRGFDATQFPLPGEPCEQKDGDEEGRAARNQTKLRILAWLCHRFAVHEGNVRQSVTCGE
jgi:hypothetical protein